MREKGKENGSLFDKLPSNFNNENFARYKMLFGHYIPPNTMQITKMTKAVNYYKGNLGRKHKKEVKKSRKEARTISQGAKLFYFLLGLPSGSAVLSSN